MKEGGTWRGEGKKEELRACEGREYTKHRGKNEIRKREHGERWKKGKKVDMERKKDEGRRKIYRRRKEELKDWE